jgi:hypothetical protein
MSPEERAKHLTDWLEALFCAEGEKFDDERRHAIEHNIASTINDALLEETWV